MFRNGIFSQTAIATARRNRRVAGCLIRSRQQFNSPPLYQKRKELYHYSTTTPFGTRNMITAAADFPSTLTSAPTLAYVEPGKCQFTTDFTSVPLLKRWKISPTTCVLRFGLPSTDTPLNLSTCACILAKADLPKGDSDTEKETVIRPYTPISTNAQIGSFDLLIKDYGPENGRMSHHLCTTLAENTNIEFKHIEFNIKMQYAEKEMKQYKNICMIVGGTGITPMLQAAHAILGDNNSNQKITMLYGSRTLSDVLGKELLDTWSSSSRLEVTHVLSHESATDSKWNGLRGFIDRDIITQYFPSPTDDSTIIFVCGPPIMYDMMCGPRTEKELTGLLAEMGYKPDQVYKF